MGSSSISGYGLSLSVTRGSGSSGVQFEKTNLNCSFKISSLSLGLFHNVPLYFSKVTPTESVFLRLMKDHSFLLPLFGSSDVSGRMLVST